ncbi:MAG: GAF domain-containing protein [Desulfobacterales bacterium]
MTHAPERKFYLKHFKAISQAIATYEDFTQLVNHLVEGMCRTFQVKGASIMLLDEIEQTMFRVSSYGISEAYLEKGRVFADPKMCAIYTGNVEIVEDFQNDERVQYPEAAAEEGISSMMSIPIKYRRTNIGLIRIYHSERLELHPDDQDSLYVMGCQLGVVIEANGLRNFVEQIKVAIDSLPPRIRGSA